jgi:hypothetical protein
MPKAEEERIHPAIANQLFNLRQLLSNEMHSLYTGLSALTVLSGCKQADGEELADALEFIVEELHGHVNAVGDAIDRLDSIK